MEGKGKGYPEKQAKALYRKKPITQATCLLNNTTVAETEGIPC